MKRKTIMLLLCAVLIITGVTALCSENVQTMFSEESSENYTSESGLCDEEASLGEFIASEAYSVESVENTFSDVCALISENEIEPAEEIQIKNNFISTAIDYNMTPSELSYVKGLFKAGYDMDKVLDVYEFIRRTNCDISAAEEIYKVGIAHSEEKNWIYDAYDKFFDRKDDILSVEDIIYYVGKGITVEEIVGAYELSFAGKKTTKQMLAERIGGDTWNVIAASCLSETPEAVIDAPEMTIDEIMGFRRISVRQRKDFADIICVKDGKAELKEEALLTEHSNKLEKDRLMLEYGVTPVVNKVTDKYADEYANSKPQLFSVSEETEDDMIPLEEPEVE